MPHPPPSGVPYVCTRCSFLGCWMVDGSDVSPMGEQGGRRAFAPRHAARSARAGERRAAHGTPPRLLVREDEQKERGRPRGWDAGGCPQGARHAFPVPGNGHGCAWEARHGHWSNLAMSIQLRFDGQRHLCYCHPREQTASMTRMAPALRTASGKRSCLPLQDW